MYLYHNYVVDWDKVNTLEDIKTLLKGLNITVQSHFTNFSEIEHLLKLQQKEPLLGTWRNEFGET